MAALARAFVPGHVTGFFRSRPDADPTRAGSQGAGIALSNGVTVTVRPAESGRVLLEDEPVAMEAVERVLSALEVTAEVRGETDLPVGAGFGVSGAMALGTAIGANAAFDRRLSTNELVTVAHGAEVQAGTGLGDVVAQNRGGLTIRLDPGGPHHNNLDGIPTTERVEYHVLGPLSTDTVLDGDTDALDHAGKMALSDLVGEPTVDRFMQASREFSRESGLLTEAVREALSDVSAAGGNGAMGMLGETVFALGTGLSDAGFAAETCHIHHAGATLEAVER